jgi:hypothetical protein
VLDALENADERAESRMDLIAPSGTVNFGDAGVRFLGKGKVNIAALRVENADNFQASSGASVTGVPRAIQPNATAVQSATQAATTATQKLVEARPQNNPEALPSIITVEVLGYEEPSASEPRRDYDPAGAVQIREDLRRKRTPR